MKNEFISQLTTLKKDVSAKSKKRDQDSRSELDKLLDETKANREKIQKLAVQFDKELADRDKQITSLRSQMLGEIQKATSHTQGELEGVRKVCGEHEVRKSDKRELMELKQLIVQGLEAKPDVGEVQAIINKFSNEQTQKGFDLKQELYKKVSEIQSLVSAGVGTKVSIEEFQEALSHKVDLTTFRTVVEQKATHADFEA